MASDTPQSNEFGPPSPERRAFLTRLSVGLSALIGVIVGVPFVGFLLAPLFRKAPEDWRPVGAVTRFKIGETVKVVVDDPSPLPWTGVAASTAAWLRREGEREFVAFAVNCTHLGCPIRWVGTADLFMCPCHGGVFYQDGRVAGGPPARPLFQYPVRVHSGQVEVQVVKTPPPV